ncbi:hypothetical protein DFP72DRAFT_1177631 [Ephemerocybe angulata]|uniref:F-box domain-containing protein n=1 Tax=Ephemerocybe angulata TaxID=980116 RepID=A0A8H6LVK8_9AGAR|nr:hypothetical protein DFP72DRAFT_1177631 [Tulosesus angulatus]
MTLHLKEKGLRLSSSFDRLNDDVLFNIISYAAEPNTRCQPHSVELEALTLLNVSHASRWLRAVSLSSPALWGKVLQPHRSQFRWIELLLDRSGKSDLYIIADALEYRRDGEGKKIWKLVETHFHRCVYLSIAFTLPPSHVYSPYGLLWIPAPNLRQCFVYAETSVVSPFNIAKHLPTSVPTLFQNEAPKLHTLRFTNCVYSSQAPLPFPLLQTMSLEATTTLKCYPLLLPDIASLKTLAITHLGPINRFPSTYSTPSSSYATKPTSLPNLEALHLTGQIPWIQALLNNLEVPRGRCCMSLDVTFAAEGRLSVVQVAAFWRTIFNNFPRTSIQNWSFRCCSTSTDLRLSNKAGFSLSISVRTRRTHLLPPHPYASGNPETPPGLSTHPAADQAFFGISWALIALRFPSVVQGAKKLTLEFTEDTPFPEHLESLIPALVNVYRVDLNRYAAQDVRCYSLMGFLPRLSANIPVLPNLRILSIPRSVDCESVVSGRHRIATYGAFAILPRLENNEVEMEYYG